jgi:hypothetical protein
MKNYPPPSPMKRKLRVGIDKLVHRLKESPTCPVYKIPS